MPIRAGVIRADKVDNTPRFGLACGVRIANSLKSGNHTIFLSIFP